MEAWSPSELFRRDSILVGNLDHVCAFGGIDWYILGPIAMTALFLGISIPLMEQRQLANKPGYAAYKKQTRLLI